MSSTNPLNPRKPKASLATLAPSTPLMANSASASAPAPAPATASATLTKDDHSGFDHLSPFDDVCASAFNTPYAPYLDTPDQTPTQTPLFDCVASEDLSSLQLDDLWTSAALPAVPAASIANDSSATQTSTLDFDLSFASASATLSSTTSSGQTAQDEVQINARLQAENALLDFVLFDDIAFPSPISTFSTPMTTNSTSPSSANSKEHETNELAMQLVAAAAASMSSQSTLTSTRMSPLSTDASDALGSLFSDVDLSPLMETTTSPAAPTASLFGSDFILDITTDAVKSSFTFDFDNSDFEIQTSPMISAGTTSPPMDMSLFLSLCSQQPLQQQQQQQQQVSLFPSPLLSAKPELTTQTVPTENPLKRKASEVQQAGEESPRQFVCAICGRAFSRLFNLNTHERTHDRSKARLFACPEQGCTKTFTRRNDCQRHQISIHKVTDIYSCNKCPKRFSSREELRSHTDRNCQEDH
ncbi:hypothetical protein EC991_010971 [Linnemannia zychae]|nr:hypothetical protein EC991_010971 [Linnemannia zychae]